MSDPGDVLAAARTWLAREAPAFGSPEPPLTLFPRLSDAEHAQVVRVARAWEAHKATAGWAGLAVPTDLGGRGMSATVALEFESMEERYGLPLDVFAVTRGMVMPTILAWGTREQRRATVPGMLAGTDLWCQLFSEPGAGSDLAAVSTRAERDGAGWRLHGQKVWTSYGHDADHGYLLARTDAEAGKYAGLTAFLIPMRDPAVLCRPIVQSTGATTFSEVFLDGLFVPDEGLLGRPGDGWKVVHTTLMNERLSISSANIPLDALVDLLDTYGVSDERLLADVTTVWADRLVVDSVRRRLVNAVEVGDEPGPEGSLAKVLISRAAQAAGEIAAQIQGPDAAGHGPWADQAIGALGLTIGGGTEEILKSLIGERVLGLPREPRSVPA